jgi:hypothetical protein
MFSGWLGVILCVPGVKVWTRVFFFCPPNRRRVPAENLCSPASLLRSSYVSERFLELGEKNKHNVRSSPWFRWPCRSLANVTTQSWMLLEFPSGACMSLARYSLRERRSKDSMALETNMQLQPQQIPWHLLRQLRQPIRIWPSARRIHLIRRTCLMQNSFFDLLYR